LEPAEAVGRAHRREQEVGATNVAVPEWALRPDRTDGAVRNDEDVVERFVDTFVTGDLEQPVGGDLVQEHVGCGGARGDALEADDALVDRWIALLARQIE